MRTRTSRKSVTISTKESRMTTEKTSLEEMITPDGMPVDDLTLYERHQFLIRVGDFCFFASDKLRELMKMEGNKFIRKPFIGKDEENYISRFYGGNPHLWGNSHGNKMFSSNLAYTGEGKKLLASQMSRHLRQAGKRTFAIARKTGIKTRSYSTPPRSKITAQRICCCLLQVFNIPYEIRKSQ